MIEKDLRVVLPKLGVKVDHKDSDWLICKCPFAFWRHDKKTDNTPSMGVHIDADRSGYHCFTCHSKGTLPNMAFQLARLRDDESLRALGHQIERDEILGSPDVDFGEWGDKTFEDATPEHTGVKFPNRRELYAKYRSAFEHPAALQYLFRRGIHPDTIATVGIRFDPRQRRVLIPVHDYWTGRFAGFTGRSIWNDAKRKAEQDRRRAAGYEFWKVPKIRDYGGLTKRSLLLGPRGLGPGGTQRACLRYPVTTSRNLVGVEGLFAYLRLTQLGYENCFALLGSELTEEKAEILRDIGRGIWWMTDDDLAGMSCLYGHYDHDEMIHNGGGALDMLYGQVAQFTVTYPEGIQDPDDLNYDQLKSMIDNAILWTKSSSKRRL